MLKIKDNVDLKELKKYGFKLEAEKSYYYKSMNEIEVFVWITKGYDYKPRYIYIEVKDYSMIVTEFDIIFDLIKDGLVEKVED